MKVMIFGASGRTGRELLLQVLARGHDVTAVVRDPKGFDIRYERLKVVAGDVLKPDSFDELLTDREVVLSTLGVTGFVHSLRPMIFYEESARAIMDRMRAHGVRRLVLVSSVGVVHDPTTPIWYRTLVQPLLRHKYADMKRMEAAVAASGLEWTVVRAAQLVGGPLTQHYRIGESGRLPNMTKVSRTDLADFLAAQVTDRTRLGRSVAISY